ncbi:unnamed protein product [Notodromas monacha]|uniref:Uncharacterized protein n=1 Tax=Notodromas monacha TaxID=399045 RepID=A0A7R9BMD7_9CRUS|nr:unnamed protein product [Notodromas monacha]CAG0918179.1 unnamed protein product [Notodromas monacha]
MVVVLPVIFLAVFLDDSLRPRARAEKWSPVSGSNTVTLCELSGESGSRSTKSAGLQSVVPQATAGSESVNSDP